MNEFIPDNRCAWALQGNEAYVAYHDKVWGVPVHDDSRHFAMLSLEGAQAGLSWQTILNKASGYEACFDGFDVEKVAEFSEKKIEELCLDRRIVRNQLKIRSVVNNARCFLGIQNDFGTFDAYIWSFVDYKPLLNQWQRDSEVPATTLLAQHISGQLKKRGFKFVGPTIIYAYMQAIGLVNDHLTGCFRHAEIKNGLSG
ncbi:MAG: DNA-3-methyladenine glycosylase I [Bacteroidota bacterium]